MFSAWIEVQSPGSSSVAPSSSSPWCLLASSWLERRHVPSLSGSVRRKAAFHVSLEACSTGSGTSSRISRIARPTSRVRSTSYGKPSGVLTSRTHRETVEKATQQTARKSATRIATARHKAEAPQTGQLQRFPATRLQGGVDPSSMFSMTNVEVKSFDSAGIKNVLPDDLGEAAIVEFGDVKVTRMRIKPGWRWSHHIKPMVGTDSCQVRHLGVVTQGCVRVVHDDGTETTYGAGDAYSVMPGHDAWVEGDETVEGFEFGGSWADQL